MKNWHKMSWSLFLSCGTQLGKITTYIKTNTENTQHTNTLSSIMHNRMKVVMGCCHSQNFLNNDDLMFKPLFVWPNEVWRYREVIYIAIFNNSGSLFCKDFKDQESLLLALPSLSMIQFHHLKKFLCLKKADIKYSSIYICMRQTSKQTTTNALWEFSLSPLHLKSSQA